MKNITKKQLEDRILQVLYLAELNLKCSKRVLSYFNEYKENPSERMLFLNSPEGRYLTLCMNNHFLEAVGLTSGLLCPHGGRNTKETSFILWKKVGGGNFSPKLRSIINDFDSQGFLRLRQNLVAHKQIGGSGDPDTIAILPVAEQKIGELEAIIHELKKECLGMFEDPIRNNYLLENEKGLGIILKRVRGNMDLGK